MPAMRALALPSGYSVVLLFLSTFCLGLCGYIVHTTWLAPFVYYASSGVEAMPSFTDEDISCRGSTVGAEEVS